jgi:hypothetical protein
MLVDWRMREGKGPCRRFLLLLTLLGCGVCAQQKSVVQPAPHGGVPRESAVAPPLADRTAVAFFDLDTGGDQMSNSRKDAVLEVVVRYRAKELRQMVATCAQPSLGSALGGGTPRELEVALCDGEFWLIAELGKVWVERKDAPHTGAVAVIGLPWSDVRAQHDGAMEK